MSREEVQDALEEVERQFGRTDDTPDLEVECPGCGSTVRVWNESDLPMGYECFRCGANYEVQGVDDVDLVDKW